jgi:hypothetical protein
MATPFDNPAFARALGARGVVHQPGMADKMLREMAPLLAEEGIDLNDPSTFDMETLNAALARATERTNLERFTPLGRTRANVLILLRLISEAISEDTPQLAEIVINGIEPEPTKPDKPSVAHVIGASLGLLDLWHSDRELIGALAHTRIPRWSNRARTAATDILALARKGRAFDAIGSLIIKYNGFVVLEGSVLAITATLQAWAASENLSVRELGERVLI